MVTITEASPSTLILFCETPVSCTFDGLTTEPRGTVDLARILGIAPVSHSAVDVCACGIPTWISDMKYPLTASGPWFPFLLLVILFCLPEGFPGPWPGSSKNSAVGVMVAYDGQFVCCVNGCVLCLPDVLGGVMSGGRFAVYY